MMRPCIAMVLIFSVSAESIVESTIAPGRCSGGNGAPETCEEEDALNLMQFRGTQLLKNVVRHDSEEKSGGKEGLDSQFSFIQDLVEAHKNGTMEKLPAEIGGLLIAIHGQAADVKKELVKEHSDWVKRAGEVQDEFNECWKILDGKNGLDKGIGAQTKTDFDAHCDLRKTEAEANIDADGCANKETCQTTWRDQKKKALDDFMGEGHCETCSNDAWKKANGASPADKMTHWLSEKQTDCTEHWTQKLEDFNTLHDAYTKAEQELTNTKKKCAALKAKTEGHGSLKDSADSAQASLNALRCSYISKTNSICEKTEQCYVDKELAWNNLKEAQTKDSEDRQNGWLAAEKIQCILKVFEIGGKPVAEAGAAGAEVTIDAKKGGDCAGLQCSKHDLPDCASLNMDELLATPIPERRPCTLPDPYCSKGKWSPPCASWDGDGGYVPKNGPLHALTPGQCDADDQDKVHRDDYAQEYLTNCEECGNSYL